MKIDVVTLFGPALDPLLSIGAVGRARARGLVELGFVNPRDFSRDKHRKVDDRPYGGGAGMILMAEPLAAAVKSVRKKSSRVVFLSPQGRRFAQADARRLAKLKHLILVCGRYEGVDERAAALFDEEISIGDYVLSGGEPAAAAVADAVLRLVPGVLEKAEAAERESFAEDGALDYPQYTRPRVWRGKKVPAALLSGNHEEIALWRRKAARAATRKKRPDLLKARDNALRV
ncbi:MAG: tRNA (guanosine(37)-N1)-methyltransferase TrmD [Elusimicrobia bacterium]|nr:tRNA (guanosine(37)-N1)-methyltransferase TrmD [Elusimicrobiota bacterium]